MKIFNLLIMLSMSICINACSNGPKVISTPVSSTDNEATGIFADVDSPIETKETAVSNDVHTVKVLEVLPTSKYVYLNVEEKGEKFWIATGKKEVKVGETYFYKKGILKTNFESKEHNRIFDKVYLVANIVAANHGSEQSPKIEQSPIVHEQDTQTVREGSIKISELVNNKSKYAGKEVQISGKCTKINANIMGRNWIHLKDGSMDEFDLVITSDELVPEGHTVTMTGVVVLDKDFGAGYKYDLIIELGKIVPSK